jgi:hypothetical protein
MLKGFRRSMVIEALETADKKKRNVKIFMVLPTSSIAD